MLKHTFRHLRGVSAKKEASLWTSGIDDWDDLERYLSPQGQLFERGKSRDADGRLLEQIAESRAALARGDLLYFFDLLERNEAYRLALVAPEHTMFLDIETTGLSRFYDQITVIGWSQGSSQGFYVRGQDIGPFAEALRRAKIVVTFNGTLFDIPFVKHQFPDLAFPPVHVDLRFLSRRAGYVGGQKEIERQLGIQRNDQISGVVGEFAPVLWHRYTRGDSGALKLLLEYNEADIAGMKDILDVSARTVLAKYGFDHDKHLTQRFSGNRSHAEVVSLRTAIRRAVIPYPIDEGKALQIDDLVHVNQAPRLRVVGIDLTGSESKASGWCLLDGREATTNRFMSDDEIVAKTIKERPDLVSIDSPLTLPDGRIIATDDDPGRHQYGIMRYSERVLKRRGVNVYPALIPSMQRLTARGIALAKRFRALGIPVIESYPGAAQDIMRIPRKRQGLAYLEQGLADFGVTGEYIRTAVSHDELDAITSAVVGVFFWAGRYERLGSSEFSDEALIIPDLQGDFSKRRERLVVGLSGSIGAGKTTAAEILRKQGATAVRYSSVIAAIAGDTNARRETLQSVGERVHHERGQRWLGRQLLEPVKDEMVIVVDGLRFPDDHAFLTEIYGSQFVHLHIVAPEKIRRKRVAERNGNRYDFDAATSHAIEANVQALQPMAREILENSDSIQTFESLLIQQFDIRDVR